MLFVLKKMNIYLKKITNVRINYFCYWILQSDAKFTIKHDCIILKLIKHFGHL